MWKKHKRVVGSDVHLDELNFKTRQVLCVNGLKIA